METDENIPQSQQEMTAPPQHFSKKPHKPLSEAAQEILKQMEGLPLPEEKIRMALNFMRTALSQPGTPRFKDFWDVRGLCLPLFKTAMNQTLRAELWSAYVEISMEARRLKEILDEQSAFAAEQIELAIAALEKDLTEYDHLVNNLSLPKFIQNCSAVQANSESYERMQRELNLLNALASRVNSLRKEVIRTDMRIKTRSKFFDRLSSLGDRIFPKRKELIKLISDQFIADVEDFAKEYFGEEESRNSPPFYVLREEIKALQGIAKELTLSTHAFNATREHLSKCWDMLREWDKKRKEEIAHKRHASQGNVQLVNEKIAALATTLQEEGISVDTARKAAQEIYDFIRTVELAREDVSSLRDGVRKLVQPFEERARAEESERLRAQEEIVRHKQEKIQNLIDEMEQLAAAVESQDIEVSLAQKVEIEERFAKENTGKHERMRFDAIQRRVKDLIADKRASNLLKLSANDQKALDELKGALRERIEMRDEIRSNLENYRKSLGSSGFDFEKAMSIREMIDSEKERLAKLNASVQDLEEKIHEFGD